MSSEQIQKNAKLASEEYVGRPFGQNRNCKISKMYRIDKVHTTKKFSKKTDLNCCVLWGSINGFFKEILNSVYAPKKNILHLFFCQKKIFCTSSFAKKKYSAPLLLPKKIFSTYLLFLVAIKVFCCLMQKTIRNSIIGYPSRLWDGQNGNFIVCVLKCKANSTGFLYLRSDRNW